MRKTVIWAMLVASGSGGAFAEPVSFTVDTTHAVVTFEALHFGTSIHRGRFQVKEGTVVLDPVAKTGKTDITIDMNTLSVALPAFESTLKGERFFKVAQNPTARFVGDSFAFEGNKVASVTGTLTILGKDQPATLKAMLFNCYENAQLKREVCGGDFETTVQRSQFNLGFLPSVSADNVKLLIQIEAIRQ